MGAFKIRIRNLFLKSATKTILILSIILIITMTGCSNENNQTHDNSTVQIANPASEYCIENGGELDLRSDESGGQYGVCIKNGQECEEWAYFRGECELE